MASARVPTDPARILAEIFALSSTQMGIVGADGIIHYSNNTEQIGHDFFTMFAYDATSLEGVRRALAGESSQWPTLYDGRPLDVAARPMRDDEGNVVAAAIVTLTVTDLVETRRRLDESETQVRRVLESNLLAMMIWDDSGTVVDCNARWLTLLGIDRERVVRREITIAGLTPPDFDEVDERARAQIIATGTITPYEKDMFHTDGSRVPVLIGAARFDITRRAGVGFLVDLTDTRRRERERKEMQQKLLDVQRLESLGVLAGGIAHDFNNLLTAIIGGASTAQLELEPGAPAHTDLDNVLAAARRASDLTRQLLAYSGKGHFQVKPIDVGAMIREIATLLESSISKKVQIRLELAADLPAIQADSAQVQQIVMNLVLNGADAIGAEVGTVLVTTGVQEVDEAYTREAFAAESLQPGRHVFVEVHDTGCGMDEATRARIFDPFFSTKFTGRGLGLAAVLGIVRAHRGAIRVYSTPGRGTTFKVLFPATEATAVVERRTAAAYRGHGCALVVDDDESVRHVARRILTQFGFEVVEAIDGRDGVEKFRANHERLRFVLLDMTMPVMDGEEAFRLIRAIDDRVPVMLTSGYNEIEATRRFVAKGIASFVQKPFTPADMAAKLHGFLPSD